MKAWALFGLAQWGNSVVITASLDTDGRFGNIDRHVGEAHPHDGEVHTHFGEVYTQRAGDAGETLTHPATHSRRDAPNWTFNSVWPSGPWFPPKGFSPLMPTRTNWRPHFAPTNTAPWAMTSKPLTSWQTRTMPMDWDWTGYHHTRDNSTARHEIQERATETSRTTLDRYYTGTVRISRPRAIWSRPTKTLSRPYPTGRTSTSAVTKVARAHVTHPTPTLQIPETDIYCYRPLQWTTVQTAPIVRTYKGQLVTGFLPGIPFIYHATRRIVMTPSWTTVRTIATQSSVYTYKQTERYAYTTSTLGPPSTWCMYEPGYRVTSTVTTTRVWTLAEKTYESYRLTVWPGLEQNTKHLPAWTGPSPWFPEVTWYPKSYSFPLWSINGGLSPTRNVLPRGTKPTGAPVMPTTVVSVTVVASISGPQSGSHGGHQHHPAPDKALGVRDTPPPISETCLYLRVNLDLDKERHPGKNAHVQAACRPAQSPNKWKYRCTKLPIAGCFSNDNGTLIAVTENDGAWTESCTDCGFDSIKHKITCTCWQRDHRPNMTEIALGEGIWNINGMLHCGRDTKGFEMDLNKCSES